MSLFQSYSRVLLFIVLAALLTLVTHQMSDDIINAMLPLYEWMLKQLEYRFDQTSIQLISLHGERILQVHSLLSQPFWVIDDNGASQQIAPTEGMVNTASLAVGNILQPLVIIGTMVLAWPVKVVTSTARSLTITQTILTYVYRLLFALPCIVLIMLFDMPIQLLHGSWVGMAAGLQLGENIQITNIAWLGYWSDFLNGGGLIAMSIAAGLVVVGLSHALIDEMIKQS